MISPSLRDVSLAELEDACTRETRRYLREGHSDSQFCLELFNRALRHAERGGSQLSETSDQPDAAQAVPTTVMYHDEDARTALVRIYTPFVRTHISAAIRQMMPVDDLVQQIWLKFWRAANSGLHFSSLGAALAYLKQTAISTQIVEQRRLWSRQREGSLQQLIDNMGEDVVSTSGSELFDTYRSERFRMRCQEVLEDPLRYRVFLMRYSMGMPPREIARVLAKEGLLLGKQSPTARTVSDLLERSCHRLSLDPEIRDLLQSD